MFRYVVFFALAVALTQPFSRPHQADSGSAVNGVNDAEIVVAHVEEEWLKSIEDRDVVAMSEVLADDFQRPDPHSGQFVTKADVLSYFRSLPAAQTESQKEIQRLRIKIYGSSAIARGMLVTTGGDGHVVSKLLFTDVFVQRAGKWLAVSAQENEITRP